MKQSDKKYFQKPALIPPQVLDFQPAVLYNGAFRHSITNSGTSIPDIMILECKDGDISQYDAR